MGNECLNRSEVTFEDSFKFPITENEIVLLRESWKVLQQHWLSTLSTAYHRWFRQYPDLRTLFKIDSDVISPQQVLQSRILHRHFEKFQLFIDSSLYELDQHATLIQTLINIGELHLSFGARQAYVTALLSSIKRSIWESMQNTECHSIRTQNAWDSLLSFIADTLKFGMRKAEKAKTLEKQPGTSVTIDVTIASSNYK